MMIHLSGALRQAIALSVALAVASPALGAQPQNDARTSVTVHGHWTMTCSSQMAHLSSGASSRTPS